MSQPLRPFLFAVLGSPSAGKLRAVDKLVLVYLKWRQGDNGHSWPSLRTIGGDLHIDRGNLLRSLRRLDAAGCIHKQPGKSGRGHPNHYEVLAGKGMPDNTLSPEIKGCPVAPFTAEKGMSGDTGKGCPVAPEGIGKEPIKSIAHRSPAKNRRQKNTGRRFMPPTVAEVQEYAASRGRPDFDAERFVAYYAAADWHDAKGTPVRNWKQKFISTWERNANAHRDVGAAGRATPAQPHEDPTEEELGAILAKMGVGV